MKIQVNNHPCNMKFQVGDLAFLWEVQLYGQCSFIPKFIEKLAPCYYGSYAGMERI